jgi:hypothetical protein
MCDSLFCTTLVGNHFHSDKYEYVIHWIETRAEIHVDLHGKCPLFLLNSGPNRKVSTNSSKTLQYQIL